MMARRIVPLRHPLYRRIGRLVVRLDERGIAIRGRGRRKWRRVSWGQLALFAAEEASLLALCEHEAGTRVLEEMGVTDEPGNA